MPDTAPRLHIIPTADGSFTLYRSDLDEHYHSVKGALAESEHVFLQAGLRHMTADHPDILEIGFGTGLNAWLTAREAARSKRPIRYTTLEPYPLPPEITGQLNYAGEGEEAYLFRQIHEAPWGQEIQVSPFFALLKLAQKLETSSPDHPFDLIYFDAFAPQKQPELWEPGIFEKCFELLRPGGILVTYCVQGQFRRNLQAAGFRVEKLPGPVGGKREMTRATRPAEGE